jgi:hypothetical protein
MVILLAAADDPQRGWGGPIAILIAFAVLGLIHLARQRSLGPSPTLTSTSGFSAESQVSAVPDTDDIAPDTDGDWWGRIVTIAGVRRRVGPGELLDEELVDGEVDLALDEPDEREVETLEDWVYDNLERMSYGDIVAGGMQRFKVSRRTVTRRIAEAKSAAGHPHGAR